MEIPTKIIIYFCKDVIFLFRVNQAKDPPKKKNLRKRNQGRKRNPLLKKKAKKNLRRKTLKRNPRNLLRRLLLRRPKRIRYLYFFFIYQ